MDNKIISTFVGQIKKNIMGTTDIYMKLPNMRKEQDFIVYPIQKGDDWTNILIQSSTRIGRLNLLTGEGQMSQSHASGAYNHHLSMDKKTPFKIAEADLIRIKEHIKGTASEKAGTNGVMFCDNSEAKMTSL